MDFAVDLQTSSFPHMDFMSRSWEKRKKEGLHGRQGMRGSNATFINWRPGVPNVKGSLYQMTYWPSNSLNFFNFMSALKFK